MEAPARCGTGPLPHRTPHTAGMPPSGGSSPHQDLARQFLGWLAGPEAQAVIPTTNWMYPVSDVGTALPAAFPAQPAKVLALDEATITASKQAWIDEALAALR